ncbi:MAG TPA: hypothetical protein VL918_13035 [Sphingobium sp.]|nr:hypothetical protein [Sphingobium sp.]
MLSTKLWREAIHLEDLHEKASDFANVCEQIAWPYDDSFARKVTVQKEAAKRLQELSWNLSGIESSLQEMAWSIDEIIELVDELSSPGGKGR